MPSPGRTDDIQYEAWSATFSGGSVRHYHIISPRPPLRPPRVSELPTKIEQKGPLTAARKPQE
jgi:hypothetical protein